MARQEKPLTEYFRVMLAAAWLADGLNIARTGWALARWFETDQGLPKHSIDEKSWRRFLGGHKPHQIRLQKIFNAVPSVKLFFDHPFWLALSLGCTKSDSVRILESFGWRRGQTNRLWFEAPSELTTLDRITCLLAMLNCDNAPYSDWEISRRLCVECVEICEDGLWKDYSDQLLRLIDMKIERGAETLSGLTEVGVPWAFKFWGLVKQDFFNNESIASACAWSAWREAVYTLNWQDQFRLKNFIENRNMSDLRQADKLDQRVYRKVRARMYRTLNKAKKTPTPVL